MTPLSLNSDDSILRGMGDRLAVHRVNLHMTQDELARRAGVSKRTVIRLEQGESVQLTNLVRVLRALGLVDRLEGVVPEPLASPMEALKARVHTERRRASSPPSPAPATPPPTSQPGGRSTRSERWVWGDEKRGGPDAAADGSAKGGV